MLTIVVAGRNDGYGINLHKRTAISLNYLATLCTEPDDEILYVDCNTPDHDRTLVEAIGDTLTPQARRYLKAFRVSGAQMQGVLGDTPLPFSDELSRNVAIRRSHPANPWLLSTNCDVLVHPLINTSLGALLRELPPRFYLCPRVGIPAAQWQMLERMNVAQIAGFCDQAIRQGIRLPPEKPEPWLRFISVGDFQLAPRAQWFQIGGCEEGMKLWGHSDANNARRLNLLNGGGRTPDLGDSFRVLHLDHYVSLAVAHEKVLVHNDWNAWVANVTSPQSRNREDWGLAGVDLPAIRLPVEAEMDPKTILKLQPRPRQALETLKVQLSARGWKWLGMVADRLQKRLGSK